jgi:hypothetical protein
VNVGRNAVGLHNATPNDRVHPLPTRHRELRDQESSPSCPVRAIAHFALCGHRSECELNPLEPAPRYTTLHIAPSIIHWPSVGRLGTSRDEWGRVYERQVGTGVIGTKPMLCRTCANRRGTVNAFLLTLALRCQLPRLNGATAVKVQKFKVIGTSVKSSKFKSSRVQRFKVQVHCTSCLQQTSPAAGLVGISVGGDHNRRASPNLPGAAARAKIEVRYDSDTSRDRFKTLSCAAPTALTLCLLWFAAPHPLPCSRGSARVRKSSSRTAAPTRPINELDSMTPS